MVYAPGATVVGLVLDAIEVNLYSRSTQTQQCYLDVRNFH